MFLSSAIELIQKIFSGFCISAECFEVTRLVIISGPIFHCLSLRNNNSHKKWFEAVAINPNLKRERKPVNRPFKVQATYVRAPWCEKGLTDVIRLQRKYMLSRFSTAIYSPWDNLKMFFFLSMIFIDPSGCHSPISPEQGKKMLRLPSWQAYTCFHNISDME